SRMPSPFRSTHVAFRVEPAVVLAPPPASSPAAAMVPAPSTTAATSNRMCIALSCPRACGGRPASVRVLNHDRLGRGTVALAVGGFVALALVGGAGSGRATESRERAVSLEAYRGLGAWISIYDKRAWRMP